MALNIWRDHLRCWLLIAALLAAWCWLASAASGAPLPPLAGNVTLVAGEVYTVSTRQHVASDTTIRSVGTANGGRAIIRGATSDGELLYVRGSRVSIIGVELDGGGIYRDKNNGAVLDGLTIDGCKIKNVRTGSRKNGVNSIQCRNLTITRTIFENCNSVTWIGDESNVTITNNEVNNCGYGFKVFGDSTNRNWVARFNYIHDLWANNMAFEFQGQCADWSIEHNLIERLRLNDSWAGNSHALITSAPMAKSPGNGRVRGNVFLGIPPSGNIYFPMAHEVGGGTKGGPAEVLYESNYVDGANVAYAVTDLDATCRIRFRNNFATRVNKVWNQNGSQELIWEGRNGGDAPPPAGFTSWSAYIADLRTKVGPNGAIAPIPPTTQPTPPVDETVALKLKIAQLEQQLGAANEKIRNGLSSARATVEALD